MMTRMPETARILPFPPKMDAAAVPARRERRAPPALLSAVLDHVAASGGGEGLFPLPMHGVNVIRAFRKVPSNPMLYRPSMCVVVEGLKQIEFSGRSLEYGVMECLIVNMELPATGRIIGATPGEPFLGITIEFDVDMMRGVLEQITMPPKPAGGEGPSLIVTSVSETLGDCLVRLMRMIETPEAIPVLYPSVMREIYYWLLTGPHGGEICRQVMPETHLERISRAIRLMRENFAQTLRVEQLAEVARMSQSSFHQHFKATTLMTPLQFQKQLRLVEARRLMVADAANVTEAAYQVGYESASQFSRDYSRAFGIAPKRDMMVMKALIAQVAAG